MNDSEVRLEHRLTKIESSQVALQDTANKILTQIGQQGSVMQDHFRSDAIWMNTHATEHTKEKAFADGRKSVRKGDLAMLLGTVTVATALVNVAARFV